MRVIDPENACVVTIPQTMAASTIPPFIHACNPPTVAAWDIGQ